MILNEEVINQIKELIDINELKMVTITDVANNLGISSARAHIILLEMEIKGILKRYESPVRIRVYTWWRLNEIGTQNGKLETISQ